MPPAGKSSSSPEFPVSVQRDSIGDFHLGADIAGVFVKFVSISQVHAQAIAAKAIAVAGTSSDGEGEAS